MMNKIFLVTILIGISLFVGITNGLSCYQHDYCLNDCPTLASGIVQCESRDSKCWKLSSPFGIKRGCGDYQCRVQVDTGVMGTASVCCSSDLCNPASQTTATTSILLITLMALIYTYWI